MMNRVFSGEISSYPTVEGLLSARRRRSLWLWAIGLLVVLVGSALGTMTNPAVTFGLMALVVLPIVVWFWPETTFYLAVAGAALFEVQPLHWVDETTGMVPWFWNITTTTRRLLGVRTEPLYVNTFEVFMLMGAVLAVARMIMAGKLRFRVGVLFWPIAGYLAFVTFGMLHGLWAGGDLKIALWEGRGQFYLGALYLLGYSVLKDRRRIGILIWVLVACALFKGLQGAVRYVVFLGGRVPSQQGLLSHDQAVFQAGFLMLLGLMVYGGHRSWARTVALIGCPMMLGTMLLNQRRLVIALIVIGLGVGMPLLFATFPDRRRYLLATLAVAMLLVPAYLRIGWYRHGAIWEPARAIRSQFEPDYRDEQSDEYREAERYNLIQTIRRGGLKPMTFATLDPPWVREDWTPWIGMGYGRELGRYTFMYDLQRFDPFIHYRTHDSLLWLWARLGTGGVVAFWFMIAFALVLAVQTLKRLHDRTDKIMAIWAVCVVLAFLMMARYDMGLSEYRPLVLLGTALGLIGALHRRAEEQEAESQGDPQVALTGEVG